MKRTYKTGEIVRGVVTGIQPYGAFVELESGITGLVHISEISDDYVRNIEDYLQIGEESLFYVTDFDATKNHASLSLKRLQGNKGKRKSPLYRQNKKELEGHKDLFTYIEDEVDKEIDKLHEEHLLTIDKNYLLKDINYDDYQERISKIDEEIRRKIGLGNKYLGWLDYPTNFSDKELLSIERLATDVREKYDTFVVCGIGGSYLGSRAGIEMIKGLNASDDIEILFVGNTFSSSYTKEILNLLENRDFAVNVISKSGSTLETSIAFSLLRKLLISKYGKDEAKKRIFVTTDKENNPLRALASKEGYTSFVIPDDIQGRYSVITPVGLFPLAVAGIDIFEFMQGARRAIVDLKSADINHNSAYQYALIRRLLGEEKAVELFVTYEPCMIQFGEWWKQLFAESEGKKGLGILPTTANYSTDLHSLGQFVQDGSKVLFETVLVFDEQEELEIPKTRQDQALIKNATNKLLGDINTIASKATANAHKEGGVSSIVLHYPRKDAFAFGYLVYFFMFAILASSYLLDVNPNNQDAVEVYKTKMKELLKKKQK